MESSPIPELRQKLWTHPIFLYTSCRERKWQQISSSIIDDGLTKPRLFPQFCWKSPYSSCGSYPRPHNTCLQRESWGPNRSGERFCETIAENFLTPAIGTDILLILRRCCRRAERQSEDVSRRPSHMPWEWAKHPAPLYRLVQVQGFGWLGMLVWPCVPGWLIPEHPPASLGATVATGRFYQTWSIHVPSSFPLTDFCKIIIKKYSGPYSEKSI